jgi:class 3 adenylate cyclase
MKDGDAPTTTADNDANRPRAALDERARSVWIATLRGDVLGPVEGLLEISWALLQDARKDPKHSDDFLESLQGIYESAQEFLELVQKPLDLGTAEKAEDEFRARFHHDLRNCLAQIIGYCELWCEDAGGPFEDDLRKIHEIAQTLVERIDDILKLRQIAGGQQHSDQPVPGPVKPESIPPRVDDDGRVGLTLTGRLLIVDDNEITRDTLRRRLVHEGHIVAVAANGRQGLQMIRSQPFDLVLLDLMMPGLSGWQVLQQLKADPRLRSLPVIMISALNELHSVVQCIETGAEDFLTRPVNPVLLRARINSSLERKRLRDQEESFRQKLQEAEKRAQELLLAILPEAIVVGLKGERRPRPRRHENVAVLMADIVNFTPYCDRHEPEEVVRYLDELIGAWEKSALDYKVQKIKTIGDAFMAAAGLLEQVDNPVQACVRFGLDMIAAVQKLPTEWDVRVGIHFGPVVAGVIGSRQYLYDLYGDTVNTAARMESHGLPGAVTLSMEAWQQIAHLAHAWERVIDVKGKGLLPTMRFGGFRA